MYMYTASLIDLDHRLRPPSPLPPPLRQARIHPCGCCHGSRGQTGTSG